MNVIYHLKLIFFHIHFLLHAAQIHASFYLSLQNFIYSPEKQVQLAISSSVPVFTRKCFQKLKIFIFESHSLDFTDAQTLLQFPRWLIHLRVKPANMSCLISDT